VNKVECREGRWRSEQCGLNRARAALRLGKRKGCKAACYGMPLHGLAGLAKACGVITARLSGFARRHA